MVLQSNVKDVLVTVLLITYNQEDYIKQSIESILSQKTDFQYKVVVHDDKSTDSTGSIIMDCYNNDSSGRLQCIFEEENQYSKGAFTGLNFFIDFVEGEFVILCEGDDYWNDDSKLQIMVDFLRNNPSYAAVCDVAQRMDESTGEVYYNNNNVGRIVTLEEIYYADKETALCLNSVLMRRNLLPLPDIFAPLPPRGADDGIYTYLTFCGGIYKIDRCMSVHRLFAKNSYNSTYRRMHKKEQRDFRKKLVRGSIIRFTQWNEYSKYKYADLYNMIIDNNKYELCLLENDYRMIKKDYMLRFHSESLAIKMNVMIQYYLRNRKE